MRRLACLAILAAPATALAQPPDRGFVAEGLAIGDVGDARAAARDWLVGPPGWDIVGGQRSTRRATWAAWRPAMAHAASTAIARGSWSRRGRVDEPAGGAAVIRVTDRVRDPGGAR